jgi:dihydroneopterin aldolase/2-amino-4-hydroxy-6-hydroxymethyldihydropteridine diphosphokinase
MPTAYIGIGSNLGDRQKNIQRAISLLRAAPQIRVTAVSSIYETKPVGVVDQPDFLNAALSICTDRSPHDLLNDLQKIESQLKRKRTIHWGPRTIDLDILLYDDKIISSDRLIIPHPEMHKRYFVLKPLSEIAGELIHPKLNKKIKILLEELNES